MLSEESVVQAVRAMRLVTYFDVAASTVFVWDYVLTLPMELDLVWRTKWNTMKCLYIVQRYLPFVDTVGLVLYHQLSVALDDDECRQIYYASGWLILIGMACSELILTVRAWAVWQRSTRLAVALSILYAIFWLPDFAFLAIFLRSLQFGNPPVPQFIGCLVTQADHILTACWVVVLVWDAIILGLMAVPGFRAFKIGGNTELIKVVFRDGALYYLVLFLLSAVNITVVKLLPPQYSQLVTSTERCFHSILTSRVLLHIRSHTSEVPPVFRQDVVNDVDSLDYLENELVTNESGSKLGRSRSDTVSVSLLNA